MKRNLTVFVVIMCLCIFACSTKEKGEVSEEGIAVAGVNFEKLSFQDAQTKAQNQDKLIMIDFFSPT